MRNALDRLQHRPENQPRRGRGRAAAVAVLRSPFSVLRSPFSVLRSRLAAAPSRIQRRTSRGGDTIPGARRLPPRHFRALGSQHHDHVREEHAHRDRRTAGEGASTLLQDDRGRRCARNRARSRSESRDVTKLARGRRPLLYVDDATIDAPGAVVGASRARRGGPPAIARSRRPAARVRSRGVEVEADTVLDRRIGTLSRRSAPSCTSRASSC